jgi:hypothetical protein
VVLTTSGISGIADTPNRLRPNKKDDYHWIGGRLSLGERREPLPPNG